ncbi:hypothetical protein V2J09_011476 [Rumex salicifolius]
MNCIVWNAQGSWSKGLRRACRYMLKHNSIDILALLEPRITGAKDQIVCDSLGFTNSFCVEAVGAKDGVWLLWNDCNTSVQIIDDYAHFIHARVQLARTSYHLIIVYGPPTPQRRVQFWEDIDSTVATITEPCFIGGDFNGGSNGLMPDSGVFSDLIDMGFLGSKFTWH